MSASDKGLQYFDLSNRWGHGMPQWPSSPKGISVTSFTPCMAAKSWSGKGLCTGGHIWIPQYM